MTLKEAIERGKELIADWQWAMASFDAKLAQKYCEERRAFETNLISEYGEDFAYDYYNGLYE